MELSHLIRLAADPEVIGVASQPFRLAVRRWASADQAHAGLFRTPPDGRAVVLDVRPDELVEPEDAAKFAATAVACARVGWGYERVGVIDPVQAVNLRWLSGYRHPRVRREPVAECLRAAFAQPQGLLAGVRAVGDPIAVLPVLFHLLSRRELTVDLVGERLSAATVVHPAPVAVGEVESGADASAASVAG